ncbi:AfsR/SARP family transcriptional regulator [Streptomyces sp. NRRL S-646]|uniref:AfsR/SARP family transcriptional regulator n=1 Tax=Streptomyces sp. NRRL S-646 TaxID=1463917 RepID=UPI0013315756|nr:BTAD domain-containing putative transcriptional regulator [Streptomyces sp. NRRL S-646]
MTLGLRTLEVPRSCQRLVVFVALRRCRVGRTHVAGTLWPVKDEARAGGNLRSALWRLNRMDVPLLDSDRNGFLMRHEVVVDTHTVSAWASRVIDGSATLPELRTVPDNLAALELLPGWYDDWALIERERLRQRLLHALEAQSRQLSTLGLHAEAIEAAIVAVGAEPLRESAQRVLAEAHLAAGNWVETRRCLHLYAELLDRELGVRLAPDLAELVRDAPVTRR